MSTIINQLENRVRQKREEFKVEKKPIQQKKETSSVPTAQPKILWIAGAALVVIVLILGLNVSRASKLQGETDRMSQKMTALQLTLVESERLLASNQEITQSFQQELMASQSKVKGLEEELASGRTQTKNLRVELEQQRLEIARLKEEQVQPSRVTS